MELRLPRRMLVGEREATSDQRAVPGDDADSELSGGKVAPVKAED